VRSIVSVGDCYFRSNLVEADVPRAFLTVLLVGSRPESLSLTNYTVINTADSGARSVPQAITVVA
jgi:hypothetical protein